jgi:hypothetical protein
MAFQRTQYGGILSLLAYIAAGIFFGFATFKTGIADIPLIAAGFFCFAIAIAFVLERFGE